PHEHDRLRPHEPHQHAARQRGVQPCRSSGSNVGDSPHAGAHHAGVCRRVLESPAPGHAIHIHVGGVPDGGRHGGAAAAA
ncbi:hypothetical protein BN1708_019960, partial [Verticillium longisporum]